MLEKFKEKHPRLHKHFFTFTTFSKLLAMILFIVLPFVGFYFGMNYQEKIDKSKSVVINFDTQNSTPIISTTSSPEILLKSEDLYSIKLPQGWKKIKETSDSPYGSKPVNYLNIRYENLDGDFFNIEINPPGSGFGADELWNYTFDENGNSLTITKNKDYQGCMIDESPMCVGGDNKLSIAILGKDQKIKSNHYFFYGGNVKKENNVNTNVYKQIIESIVFK